MRTTVFNPHPMVIALGFLVSPESLAKLGNGAGLGGWFCVVLLILAAVIYFVTGSSYDRLQQFLPGPTIESRPLGSLLGQRVAVLAPLLTRIPAFVCLGTAVLATAGFVFNEVFVYWFPNFAFSFLLLGLCLLVNLLSDRAALTVQLLCVLISLTGLLALTLVAAAQWSMAPISEPLVNSELDLRLPVLCFSLFMGFELGVYAPARDTGSLRAKPASGLVVLLCAVLFVLWAAVSLHFVPAAKLAESSLPHMLASRAIWGEAGRVIMGAVALAGCCSVVNGSLLATKGLVSGMIHLTDMENPPFRKKGGERIGICLVSAAIAAFLGSGLAGESALEAWIRGSVILWMMGYVAFHLALCAFCLREYPSDGGASSRFPGFRTWAHAGVASFFALLVALSIGTEPEKETLTAFLLLAPSTSCIILVAWNWMTASRRTGTGI